MTIDQKKIALINWITNLKDETIVDLLADLQNKPSGQLPEEIIELLKLSDSTEENDCIEHSSAKSLLSRK